MRNCIITPTFEGHFCYIGNYLHSFKKNVVDAANMPIAFILSNAKEVKKLQQIIAPYHEQLNINCYDFEQILQFYGIKENSDKLLKKYGGRSYQTLKKIYSMLYINSERFFVLDSESIWITKTNMSEEFDKFFSNPFIVVSDWETRLRNGTKFPSEMEEHYAVANYVVGKPMEKFLFEHFMWFYSKELINDLCETYGYPHELIQRVYEWEDRRNVKKEGLMETLYVMNFIYEHREKYGYCIIQAEEELKRFLGDSEYIKYNTWFFNKYRGGRLGIIEFPCDMLTKANCEGIIELFKNNGIIVSRCDGTSFFGKNLQKKFIRDSGIKVLAVSQEHIYIPDIRTREVIEKMVSFTWSQFKDDAKVRIRLFLER